MQCEYARRAFSEFLPTHLWRSARSFHQKHTLGEAPATRGLAGTSMRIRARCTAGPCWSMGAASQSSERLFCFIAQSHLSEAGQQVSLGGGGQWQGNRASCRLFRDSVSHVRSLRHMKRVPTHSHDRRSASFIPCFVRQLKCEFVRAVVELALTLLLQCTFCIAQCPVG